MPTVDFILRRIRSYDPDWRNPDDFTVHAGDTNIGRIFRRTACASRGQNLGRIEIIHAFFKVFLRR
jgi:hypothetical protein